MKHKILIIVASMILLVSLAVVSTVSATDEKSLSVKDDVAQVLLETQEALKDLKADDSSNSAVVARLEKLLKKLEKLTANSANTQLNQKPNDAKSLLGDNFFSHPFDADNWNPLQEMQAMQNQMNQLFGESFGRFGNSSNFNHLLDENGFSPNMNLVDDEKQFIVTVDLPGATKDDVEIILKDQLLTIKGSTIETKETKDEINHIFRSERFSGNFTRSITLPAPVKSEGMHSKITNGVLEIKIPKA